MMFGSLNQETVLHMYTLLIQLFIHVPIRGFYVRKTIETFFLLFSLNCSSDTICYNKKEIRFKPKAELHRLTSTK